MSFDFSWEREEAIAERRQRRAWARNQANEDGMALRCYERARFR